MRSCTHLLAATAIAAAALSAPGLGAAEGEAGPWWPCFHGPNHDNISPDKGLLKEWPKEGPPLAWKFSESGKGYAGVAIADGLIYTAGDFGDVECLFALTLDGKLVWKAENGKAWKGAMPGSRTTPTFEDGVLYHMNPTGRLAAYEAKTGKELWAVELKKEFDARWGMWAMSENIVLDGDKVLCAPGGAKGRLVALDKKTGKTLWANTDLNEATAYCTPIVITHNGIRQAITIMQKTIVSLDVTTGKTLWTHPHSTAHDQNVTMPIYKDGFVAASSGHGTGVRLLKLADDSKSVTEVWLAKELDNCHGGMVLLDGCLLGMGCRLNAGGGFACVDFKTGKCLWKHRPLGKLSFTVADGLLYGTNDVGKVFLVDARPAACRIISQFSIPKKTSEQTLCHPVVCGGRLYLRHWDELFVYDVSAGK